MTCGKHLHVARIPPWSLEYNHKPIAFPDQKPLIKDSRALVPLRPIAEGLGFDVDWNSQTRTGLIQKGDAQIKLIVSRKIAKRNGEIISLDVPAQIVNQRTMVPVRFIAEALSYDVNWDGSNQTVLIKDKAEEGKAPASLVTSPERKQE
ncbi:copper amine oxidase N-terminal domain-containing protein [Brevibacillus borstelensis]|nr:copper amine oxidase N-terminal domain-containing protein [Brevibacillus borstelensis]